MSVISPDTHPKMARVLQACEQCRNLKVRCLLSEQPGVCQRCVKSRKECTFIEQQPRRKRGRESRSRVNNIESKLDGLIALLGQPQSKVDSSPITPFSVAQDAPIDSVYDTPYQPEALPNMKMRDYKSENVAYEAEVPSIINSDMSYSTIGIDDPLGIFDRGVMTVENARRLLKIFHNMNPYFPFVVVPANATVQSMLQTKPFLFLAILAAASSTDKPLQKILDEELRNLLSRKVILEGEKSMDLLQGLLVYLAWYQYHFLPRSQQSYQFLQISIGMTIDLGLDQMPRKARTQKFGLDLSHHDKCSEAASDEFFSREARRAYIGCYYLSIAISILLLKPNNLRYKEYMIECALSLQDEAECVTDRMLPYLIRLQHLGEDVQDMYRMERSDSQTEMGQVRLQVHVKTFKAQLEDWRASLPLAVQQYPIINLAYHSTSISIHEMGLLYTFHTPSQTKPPLPATNATLPASIRLNTLFTCLDAIKSFLETFLSLKPHTYRLLSIIEWSRLIHATFILYRLSLGTPSIREWDVQVARNTVKLELYLESLCYRMRTISIPQSTSVESGRSDLFTCLPTIFENVRNTYQRLREMPYPDVEGGPPPHEDFTAEEEKRKAKKQANGPNPNRCPAFQYTAQTSQERSVGSETGWFVDYTDLYTPEDAELWDGDLGEDVMEGLLM